MFLRVAAGLCLGLWILLVAAGKSGFAHILLLIGIACAVIEAATIYRSSLKE